ncbi:MAG: CvpA family protein [Fusobacterium sp.]|nr:CvpA family protein [Fusobacterium sp.]
MYLDMAIGIVVLFSLLYGLKNGLFVEFLAIFGLVINFIIAKRYTPTVIDFLNLSKDRDRYFIVYVVTFWAVYIILGIIVSMIRNVLDNQGKGIILRVLGAILGGIKGIFLSLIILLIFNYSADIFKGLKKYSAGSYINKIFLEKAPELEEYIPDAFQAKLKELKNGELVDRYIDKIF